MTINSAKKLNSELLEAIKRAIPANTNLVKVIEAELKIGKEGVYRRIRGDVPFTFREVVALFLKFGMSLDRFFGITYNGKAVFDLNHIYEPSVWEDYYNILSIDVEMFKEFNRHSAATLHLAYNILPVVFYSSLDVLWRFDLYRCLHQLKKEKRMMDFAEMVVPAQVVAMRDQLFASFSQVPHSSYILDRKVISSLIKEIHYFHQLRLISDEDKQSLKEELLTLLNEWGMIMATGKCKNGNDVTFYLSNIDIEASYCSYECPQMNFSHLRIYRIGVLNSSSQNVYKAQRGYLESLKRFSTLVTVSGELERRSFLETQRELIMTL